jgi:methionine synthase I (cobalamin-dependent)
MGTALIARGLTLSREPPEAWTLARPDAIREVHRGFRAAGAQLLQTNTFGGNRVRLRASDRQGAIGPINRRAVELCRAEADGARVVGVIGPSGLVPGADVSPAELEDAFAEQATLLAEAGADLLHVETFYHPVELGAALRGARAGAPALAVIGSFTCGRDPAAPDDVAGFRTPAGFAPAAMLAVLAAERADAVGVCCSLPAAALAPLVRQVADATEAPVVAQPIPAPGRAAPAERFATAAHALFAAGASIVGGCCGVDAADLAALVALLG